MEEETQAAIAVNKQRGPRTYTPRTDASPYLFSGPNAEGELMFMCSCGSVVKISKEYIETLVVKEIFERYSSDLFTSEVLNQIKKIIDDLNANGNHELQSIEKELSKLQNKNRRSHLR
jgi:hypothetical protein